MKNITGSEALARWRVGAVGRAGGDREYQFARAVGALWAGLCIVADNPDGTSRTLDEVTRTLASVAQKCPLAVRGLPWPRVMGGGEVE